MSQTRRLTGEGNEHVYGLWRIVLREFNIEKLIRIDQKSITKLDIMFESGLVASRSRLTFKGYQQTFPDFIHSALASNKDNKTNGLVNVDLDKSPVHQLWGDVQVVLNIATEWMVMFL